MEYIHFEAQLCNKISICKEILIFDNLSLHPCAQVCSWAVAEPCPRLASRFERSNLAEHYAARFTGWPGSYDSGFAWGCWFQTKNAQNVTAPFKTEILYKCSWHNDYTWRATLWELNKYNGKSWFPRIGHVPTLQEWTFWKLKTRRLPLPHRSVLENTSTSLNVLLTEKIKMLHFPKKTNKTIMIVTYQTT